MVGTPSLTRLRALLFLVLWCAYGAAISSSNLVEFDLQQIGVEAMVERGHFYLEGSPSLHMQTKGDVFEYRGHRYAAKQPGQFMAGAVVYWPLHALGLSYADRYLLTSALVTFLTASLVVAASGVALLEIAREMTGDGRRLFWPLAATLSYALATTALSYSGIAHHDALATGYLVGAFWLLLRLSRGRARGGGIYLEAPGAGLLLGLTITTSMLPFVMTIVCVLYFLGLRRWRLLPVFLIGLVAGLLPLFVYNLVSFGNPFLLPNVAGARVFADTFFHIDAKNLAQKVAFYASSVAVYVPVLAVGLLGWAQYPRHIKHGPEWLTLVALLIAHGAFVVNIESDGDCQFGPRYLLPAMPFACLGIGGYRFLAAPWSRWWAGVAVLSAGALSFGVNLVGALRGVMSCPHGERALWNHVMALGDTDTRSYPLAVWLLAPLAVAATLLVLDLAARRLSPSCDRDRSSGQRSPPVCECDSRRGS